MKTTRLMAGVMAISMVASPMVFAQTANTAPGSGTSEQGAAINTDQKKPAMKHHEGAKREHKANAQHQMQGGQHQMQGGHNTSSGVPGQATNAPLPEARLEQGGKLPQSYRLKQYVVDDWKGHGLTAPGKNHHWVQVGAEYALVSNAGVISKVQSH